MKHKYLKESKRNLKESAEYTKIRDAVDKAFDYSIHGDFFDLTMDIVESALDRVNKGGVSLQDAVYDAMDGSALIYYGNQWLMMEFYQTPQEANFDNAWSDYESDLATAVSILAENNEEDIEESLQEDWDDEPLTRYGVALWYNLKGNYDLLVFDNEQSAEDFAKEYSDAYEEWYNTEYQGDEEAENTLTSLVQPIFDAYSKEYEYFDEIYSKDIEDDVWDRYDDGMEMVEIVDKLDYGF